MVKLGCDKHPWMKGWVVVTDSPWFASTGETGSFEIKNVPPGNYVLEAWHEKLGTRTAAITVKPAEATKVMFSYSAQ